MPCGALQSGQDRQGNGGGSAVDQRGNMEAAVALKGVLTKLQPGDLEDSPSLLDCSLAHRVILGVTVQLRSKREEFK